MLPDADTALAGHLTVTREQSNVELTNEGREALHHLFSLVNPRMEC